VFTRGKALVRGELGNRAELEIVVSSLFNLRTEPLIANVLQMSDM
jgi:hypothetical protein